MSIERNILAERGIVIAKNGMGVNGHMRIEAEHFADLACQISHNDQLLHPDADQMAKSYRDGKAVALFGPDHRPIGYMRFTDATTLHVRKTLGLHPSFPDITELGTVYIDKEHQGLGLNPIMQNELLSTVIDEVRKRRLLILLTTKTQKVVNSLNKAELLGMRFTMLSHTDPRADMIAPFTCTCSGDFGSGFGEGRTMAERRMCPKRVSGAELITIQRKADLARQGVRPQGDPALHCVMGVSDLDLMMEMNGLLRAQFEEINVYNPQQALVELLQKAGHFD